jgi:hypothetical protein
LILNGNIYIVQLYFVCKLFQKSSTEPNLLKLWRDVLWHILYKRSTIGSGWMKNMAAITKNRTYGKIAVFGYRNGKPTVS